MPDYDFRAPRLFVEGPLEAERAVPATPAQANYLLNVMRLADGAHVLVFDGRSGEWTARLNRVSKKALELVPERRVREQTPPGTIIYLFAPLKHARLDYMVQKATEMGVGILQPVATQHTQVSRFNRERAEANAVEAAEQCGILAVPECREMVRLTDLLADWDKERPLVFCDEAAPLADPLDSLRPLQGRAPALLIGPEGGFSKGEREALLALPFTVAISLGPRILRADTAAVAGLAVLQAAAGDWARQ